MGFGEYVKAYKAKRFVVMTENNMRICTADEQTVAFLNLAVPSPILSETEPIFRSGFQDSGEERDGEFVYCVEL